MAITPTLEFQIQLLLYIILGGLIGLVYGLRRVLMMEKKIVQIDRKIAKLLEKKR